MQLLRSRLEKPRRLINLAMLPYPQVRFQNLRATLWFTVPKILYKLLYKINQIRSPAVSSTNVLERSYFAQWWYMSIPCTVLSHSMIFCRWPLLQRFKLTMVHRYCTVQIQSNVVYILFVINCNLHTTLIITSVRHAVGNGTLLCMCVVQNRRALSKIDTHMPSDLQISNIHEIWCPNSTVLTTPFAYCANLDITKWTAALHVPVRQSKRTRTCPLLSKIRYKREKYCANNA